MKHRMTSLSLSAWTIITLYSPAARSNLKHIFPGGRRRQNTYLKLSFYFIPLVFFFNISFLHAQFGRVSPKAGVAFSHLDNLVQDQFSIKGRSGFIIGADWRVEDMRVFVQPGFYIQNVNLRLSDPDDNTLQDLKSRITSVKAPLTLGWYVNGRRRLAVIHARTGFIPEVILGAKSVEELAFNKNMLNTFQLNGMFGLGVDLAIFSIDLSHEVGLLSLIEDGNTYNRITVLRFGLIF